MDNKRMGYMKEAERRSREWAKGDAIRDEGVTVPEGVRLLKDIVYRESSSKEEEKWHLTDIYYPEEECESYPVIVSIHGGGYFYGDKELYKLYTTYLASKGFAVINFNYRLSPQYVYPAGFSDVCYLMNFIIKNAKEYKLDLSRLYVVGDSAGAQLTSQYSIYSCSKEYRDLFDFSADIEHIRPVKIALNCGIYDMERLYKDDPELSDWYLPEVREENIKNSFFKVLTYMNKDFPPTYLMLSINDGLATYTQDMKAKLEELMIEHIYCEFGENDKADSHVFHLNMRSKDGIRCNQEEIEFFLG